jgi:hypothetical protein
VADLMDLVAALQSAPVSSPDLEQYLARVVAEAGEMPEPERAFPYVFRFFERYPDAELGMPGPLVHWLERYYPRYVDELERSLKRKPTTYAVWMVHRVLNSAVPAEMKQRLLPMLENAVQHAKADDLAKEAAATFLAMARERAGNAAANGAVKGNDR